MAPANHHSWADVPPPPDHETPAPAPQGGDVIVRREPAEPEHRYTLSLFPSEAQLSCKTREAALAIARGYARQHRTRVWEEDNGVMRPEPSVLVPADGRARRKMAKARSTHTATQPE